MILDLFKIEAQRLYSDMTNEKTGKSVGQEMMAMFEHAKLIGRDDARKFENKGGEEKV
jgi:hypothetical protein